MADDIKKKKPEEETPLSTEQQQTPRPAGFNSPWSAQMDDALNRIMNREKFNYDINGDALYNQYKDQYVRGGQMASQDAMGQAAALTGGYGNSYAEGVSAMAYQNWLNGLNDKVPDLYRLAADRYQKEGDDLLNQYNLYGQREAQDYKRWEAARGDLMNLISTTGYNPTDDEIANAGLTRPQVDAMLQLLYLQHPELAPKPAGGGGGGGGYSKPHKKDKSLKDYADDIIRKPRGGKTGPIGGGPRGSKYVKY